MKKILLAFLTLLTISFSVAGQNQVTGTVTDEKGEPLIGVSIQIKGTTSGTTTDNNGNYTLNIAATVNEPVLIFSYIGFTPQEIPVAGEKNINVTLKESVQLLNEVVVVGYGTQKKADLTGSVSVVEGSQLTRVTTTGIDQALQGRAAGVAVSQNSGAPGDGVAIRIRGTGSIFSNNDPLYVIDGIPTKDPLALNNIPSDEIESISILKDASSAAIYGSRANNGVVLITTKKALKGEGRIQFRAQYGVQQHGRLIPMVSTQEYVNIYNEMANNDNPFLPNVAKMPLISSEYAATLPNINHMEEIFRNAAVQTYDLTISGGKEKTTYLISGSYLDQDGIIYNSGFKRGTARASINSEVNKWLTVAGSLNIYHSVNDIMATTGDGYGGNGSNPVRYAFFRSPAIPTYDENGNFVDLPDHPEFFGDGYNPLGVAKYTDNTRIDNGYSVKFNSTIKLAKNLNFITNAGADYNNYSRRRFNYNWGTSGRINNPNSLEVVDGYSSTWTINNVLNYTNQFAGKHNVTLMLGEESIKSTYYDQGTSIRSFPNQDPNLVYLPNGTTLTPPSESKSGTALQSFFGRANYDYLGRYLVSFVIREDGTSKFASQNRWGTFYSGSLGWVISQESFLRDVRFIERWKIRAGYGRNGNQDITPYAYTDKLSPLINYPFGGIAYPGYATTELGNINVKWETATQYDIGTDISLWKGMFSLTADYFYKVTHDMLVPQATPPSVGYAASPWINNGEVLNRGLEVELTFRQKKGNFGYSISANVSTIHNEVLKMDGAYVDNPFLFTKTEKGYPIGSFYMWKMEGIFQDQTSILGHASQGNVNTGHAGDIRPGDVMYKDVNNDGKIDEGDRTHVGSPIPKLTGGLNFGCNWKNFDLTLFIHGVYGDDIYFQAARDIEGFYRPFPVTQRYYKEHWTGPGTSNTQPIASWADAQNNTATSTRFLEDGSFLRLKNVQIGYVLPKTLVSKIHIERLRVYFSGTNLYTLTKYSGLDPEMSTNNNAPPGSVDLVKNVDWGTFPTAISYNLGLELTF
jgi:TonB-dependent starch-binding outer membrane protein SusC